MTRLRCRLSSSSSPSKDGHFVLNLVPIRVFFRESIAGIVNRPFGVESWSLFQPPIDYLMQLLKEGTSIGAQGAKCGPLRMVFQDDTSLVFSENCSSELGCPKAQERQREREVDEVIPKSVFRKLVVFSSFMGMPIEGFEKEVISLLRKTQARKGCDNSSLGEKRKLTSTTCFKDL